jgi:hypothetical protein
MSKKRMMSKAQRIYYEQSKKKRIEEQLREQALLNAELERYKDNAYRGKDY